ncbi:hypothetical protein GEMRC1_008650 [Eukaryota sp. GEM-RC1]
MSFPSSPPLLHITPLPLFGPSIVSILPSPYFSSSNMQLFFTIVRDPRPIVFLFILVLPLPLVLSQGLLLAVLQQQYLLGDRGTSLGARISLLLPPTLTSLRDSRQGREHRLDRDLPPLNSSDSSL